jgi:hypothetical protein
MRKERLCKSSPEKGRERERERERERMRSICGVQRQFFLAGQFSQKLREANLNQSAWRGV